MRERGGEPRSSSVRQTHADHRDAVREPAGQRAIRLLDFKGHEAHDVDGKGQAEDTALVDSRDVGPGRRRDGSAPDGAVFRAIDGSRVWATNTNDLDVPFIVRYELVRPGACGE